MATTSAVPLFDAIRAIAFVGDLAMGQPTDHSWRTSWLAAQLAHANGGDEPLQTQASVVALLRWSGCTANAHEFAQAFGDDVAQRESLLAMPSADTGFKQATRDKATAFFLLSQIHCEVAGDIAALLELGSEVQFALRHLFEFHDGTGAPEGLAGDAVPVPVYLASIAGDLEIFHRLYGLEQACALLRKRADRQYPAYLVDLAIGHARSWLIELDARQATGDMPAPNPALLARSAPLEVLADVIDLKLPWMSGHSRLAAELARDAARRLGLDQRAQERLYRAGLIHGIGRAAVPNMIWNVPSTLSESAWERIRLVPYWTARAGKLLRSLDEEARLASLAYERMDGSGYYRGIGADSIPTEARILAAAVAKAALGRPRPWRNAFPFQRARELLFEDAQRGRLDGAAVRALFAEDQHRSRPLAIDSTSNMLTDREKEVLRWISLGESNKGVAQKLSISASTVRTHVESVFRKLGCTTRAAATLKAMQLGLLDPLDPSNSLAD